MSTHKHFDKICCVVLAATLLLTALFLNGKHFGVQVSSAAMGYAGRLFNTSSVHTVDIVMDDWDDFISTCTNEEYAACTIIIDGESYKNVGIRAKGNTSLTQVSAYGNDRYSFKIEFGHYDSTKSYYGLDKLCLNNIIQDNTYMKDFLTYQMMAEMGVPSPLCSYADISVNGEAWGLYLALEGVEESFLTRNYGRDYGNLYKPDSMNMGGGRGNGKDFKLDDWNKENGSGGSSENDAADNGASDKGTKDKDTPENGTAENPIFLNAEIEGKQGKFNRRMPGGGGPNGMSMGSDDVLLKYVDDAFDSYANIFDNAKTKVSDSDKKRLIASLKNLSAGENLAETVAIEQVIRYFVVHNFVLNFDSYTGSMIHNYYLYEKDGQLSMIPWDYNLAFGGFTSAGGAESLINYPIDSPISGGNTEDRPMIAWIFANEEYTAQYHQYFGELLTNYFDSGKFSEWMDSTKALISPYVEKDPTKFCTYEEFTTGIDTLKEFCLLRAQSIQGQLDGTIGATSETQNQDTLVDAGDIVISDMGSMGNRMGNGRNMGTPPSFPDGSAASPNAPQQENGSSMDSQEAEDGSSSDSPQAENGSPPNSQFPMMQTPPEMEDAGNFTPPTSMPGQSPEGGVPSSSWILLGISICVLAFGLLFALLFQRRR
ncbi:MAG: spore coat protein CotH [Lachnospiraceae bacterium]|nr:spore coat protein CotH [Lachnospiraceae bacterium]